jgi:hypothetical protein
MSRFTGLLNRTAARLDLPRPAKSRVLLEMAADLEDMFAAYRQRGLGEDEAMRRVEEKFDASDDTLTELTVLHRSAFGRGIDAFSEQASTPWEKLMLVAVLLFVAASTGTLLLYPSFFTDANAFVWPGVALGIAATGIFLVKARRLFMGKNHRPRRLRRGLPSLLFIACAALFNGVFGFFLEMQSSMFRIAAEYETGGAQIMPWLVGSTATMILSLLAAILAALLWFVLMSKVRRIELLEAARLLGEKR